MNEKVNEGNAFLGLLTLTAPLWVPFVLFGGASLLGPYFDWVQGLFR